MAGFVVLSIVGGLFALISLGMLLNSITKDGASTSLERVWGTEGASGNLRAIRISGTIMTDAADGALLSSGTYGYEVADQLDSLKTDQPTGWCCWSTPLAAPSPDPRPSPTHHPLS